MPALLAAALLCAEGCMVRGQPVTVGPGGPGGATVGVGTTRGWTTKEVVQKQPPRSLLARDGTHCDVTEERFKETRIGAQVPCEWR